MSRQTFDQLNYNDLVDIADVTVDPTGSEEEKIAEFLEQIKNPYCFLCGDVPVRISFAEDGSELANSLIDYFVRIKRG